MQHLLQIVIEEYKAILRPCELFCLGQHAGGSSVVTKVEARQKSGSDWRTMNNVWGSTWELANAPQRPLDICISDGLGNTVPVLLLDLHKCIMPACEA